MSVVVAMTAWELKWLWPNGCCSEQKAFWLFSYMCMYISVFACDFENAASFWVLGFLRLQSLGVSPDPLPEKSIWKPVVQPKEQNGHLARRPIIWVRRIKKNQQGRKNDRVTKKARLFLSSLSHLPFAFLFQFLLLAPNRHTLISRQFFFASFPVSFPLHIV